MKIKSPLFLFVILVFIKVDSSYSQNTWNKQDKMNSLLESKDLYQKKHFPSNYEILSLDIELFTNRLKSKFKREQHIIELPNADGSLSRFVCKETSNFETKLQAKFPNVKSYSAQGIDDSTAIAKISIGSDGFHAVIFSTNQETVYIDPYSRDDKDYIVYKRSSLSKVDEDFKCEVETTTKKEFSISDFNKNANDGKLRTFRLALVCSAEYAQFHLGADQQNIPDTAADEVKKEAVLSAMNTSMTRINGILEKDLSIKLVLVNDNNKIIFLDTVTDGITEGNANSMIAEVQTICDSNIGDLNYDIGHIFSTGGSGLAGLGVVCLTGRKARGVTGIGSPVGDPYDVDYVAHEMGHQFGATHTQNNDCNRTDSTAVEPGSGSTIMGYAGICSPNVLSVGSATGNSDDYFHTVSIAQMWSTIETSANCALLTDTNNEAPIADAGLDYSIPKSTPFKLKGTATDEDGMSRLTYNWEQLDNEAAVMPPEDTNTLGPMFRSLPSKIVPVRFMPDIATVMLGSTSTTWEVVPSVARELNFSFLVRDNHLGGGSADRDDMKVEVVDAEAFLVTSQSEEETFISGQTISVTWNKGTTDVAPIDCQNVNIKLSIDGGVTFPIFLKIDTPNDGAEDILVPDNATADARIMVEAADNIFYNVNTSKFNIDSSTPTFLIIDETGAQSVCNADDESVIYILDFNFINDFTETATLSATGNPVGSSVIFNPATINADGNVIVTVSNLKDKEAGNYEITIVGASATVTQSVDLVLKLQSLIFNPLILSSPENGETDISIIEVLSWVEDETATSYDVDIALESGFNNIISSGTVNENSYTTTNLNGEAQYFWRVKPKNDCGEGNFSDVFSFTTEAPLYCASTFTDDLGGREHITNVTFGGINNSSGNDVSDGYQDFTSINTNVLRGQAKQISVTLDTDGYQDHCFVYIDWNQDFVFDKTTERYDLGTELEDVGTRVFTINVPSDAKFGSTTMRVVIEYDHPTNNYGDGACDSDHLSEWGETEDYSVTIVEPVLNDNNITIEAIAETFYNAEDGIINISMIQSEFSYLITIIGDVLNNSETISNTSYTIEDLSAGNYEICITAIEVDVTECFTVVINKAEAIINFDNYTIQTTSESCVDENDGIITVGINQSEFEYQVTVSGPSTNINELLTGTTYTLSSLSPGDYEVCFLIEELNYTQCFELNIVSSEEIALKVASKQSNTYSFNIDSGTAPFKVYFNEELLSVSDTKEFELEIFGNGKLEVKTAKDCEGSYKTSIGEVSLKQNPISDSIDLLLPIGIRQPNVNAIIFDLNGKIIFSQHIKREQNTLSIPFKDFALGIYILKLSIENSKPIKIIKQ